MKYFLLIVKSIVIPIIAVFFCAKWNFLKKCSFIPDDKQFDLLLIIYMAVLELAYQILVQVVQNNKIKLKVIVSEQSKEFIQGNEVRIKIKANNSSRFYCSIHYDEKKLRIIKYANLILKFPDWVDAQVNRGEQIITTSENGVLTIPLKKVISTSCINSETIVLKILVSSNYSYDETDGDAVISICGTNFIKGYIINKAITFKCNKLNLKYEEG